MTIGGGARRTLVGGKTKSFRLGGGGKTGHTQTFLSHFSIIIFANLLKWGGGWQLPLMPSPGNAIGENSF